MSDPIFNAYSRYYDLLYGDKDYVAETDYIARLLDRFDVTDKHLLEFGSGTGKHGRLLAKRGYQVVGIERSAEMVAQAESVPGFVCQQGDICTVELGRSFGAVLSFFHVMSYQVTNEAVGAVFARAAEHLRVGGLFLFDVWYGPAVHVQKPQVRVKRMADGASEITRIAEPALHPNDNRVDVNYTIFATDVSTGLTQVLEETHPMRHFSLPELDFLAGAHGFVRIDAEEFLTGNEPGEATWSVCVALKRL